ncbi:hypothetical protein FDP41_001330 [Naegleria fowleri]|uniref:Uncharacterized protein n=1 Tax=Naegleria fowleri TaxID=5763 RepID=A0A6A5BYH6_NAEFO|nr:uncharacterized protein FDP41_001330 [Naegleria fowleri]KAF0979662.1 hypothetical protein FDP41_001330 [Naegleria fowleri]
MNLIPRFLSFQQDGGDSSILFSLLATTFNNTLNSTANCHPLLFTTGLSREETPTIENSICPDTYVSFSITLLFLIYYLLLLVISSFGILWKRHSKHVKARNIIHMFLTLGSSFFFITIFCLRIIIGRKYFPCGLYSWCFCLSPLATLPTTCRSLLLYFSYKLNLIKMKLGTRRRSVTQEEDVEEEVEGSMTSDSGGKMPSVEIGEKTFPMIQSCSSISGNTPFSLSTTSETILFPQTPQSVSKTISDDTNGNVELLMSLSPSIPSLNNNALTTKSPCSSNAEIAPKHSLLTMEEPTQNKEISTSDISVSDHEKRLIKIYQFLTSYKFVVLIYIISLIFSTCLWLLMGGIEEGIYVSQHGTKPKIFTFAGFLEFKLGCTLTTNCLILILSLAMVYCLFEAIAIILSIRADRDTWQIKKENFVVLIVEVIGLACFIILGLVPQVQSLIDFLVPYGLILFFSFSVESIISVLMPAIYEIRNDWLKDWKRQKHEDEHVDSYVEQLLKNSKNF